MFKHFDIHPPGIYRCSADIISKDGVFIQIDHILSLNFYIVRVGFVRMFI